MKNRRSTQRSFPGRLTLEEWLALPDLGRRDMIHRAQCEVLHCHRLCADKECRRHRACCGDDSTACERRLRRQLRAGCAASLLELERLENLCGLPGLEREIERSAAKRMLWTAALYDPWHAPALFPGALWEKSLSSSATGPALVARPDDKLRPDDPVIADTRSFAQIQVNTGCPAFAGHDKIRLRG